MRVEVRAHREPMKATRAAHRLASRAILSAHFSRMVPRTSWKGFLRLSLISVPVKAFTANNTSEEIHLNQLHKDCNSRVRYQKVCPEHGELNNEQIVKGYEYAKD